MKKFKKNQKFFYSTLLASTLLVSGAIGTSAALLHFKNDQESYVKFAIGTSEVVLEEAEINQISKVVEQSIEDNIEFNFLLEQKTGISREDGGDGTDGGETTTVPEATKTQLEADLITSLFMELALVGEVSYVDDEGIEQTLTLEEGQSPILNPQESDNWIAPHINDYDLLFSETLKIKVFSETTGAQGSAAPIYQFIANNASLNYNLGKIAYDILFGGGISNSNFYETWWDIQSSTDWANFTTFLELLSEEITYQKYINNFIYTYSYLWQEDSSSNYDYYLTRIMKQNSFAYYWNFTFIDEEESFGIIGPSSSNPTSSAWDNFNKIFSEDSATNKENWNLIIEGTFSYDDDGDETTEKYEVKDISSNQYGSLQVDGYKGLQGLTSKSSSTIKLEEDDNDKFWDYSNVYNFVDEGESNYSSFTLNNFGLVTVFDGVEGNYAIKVTTEDETDPETGEVITPGTTTYNVFASTLIYPFAFGLNYNDIDGTADEWFYRLEAYESGGSYYLTDPGGGTKVNYFDLLGQTTKIDPATIELYFIHNLISYLSSSGEISSIETTAYDYWRTKGFYIELSGDYKDDYGDLIPSGIQKR